MIIIVVVSLIGLLAWRIHDSKKATVAQQSNTPKSTVATTAPSSTTSADSLKTYQDPSGVTFSYPKTWFASSSAPYTGENAGNSVVIVSDIDAKDWFSGKRDALAGHQAVFIAVYKGTTGPSFGSQPLANGDSIFDSVKIGSTSYKLVARKYNTDITTLDVATCTTNTSCSTELARTGGTIKVWVAGLNNAQAATVKIKTTGEEFTDAKGVIESLKF